ncbi:MAG: hypothetical protein KQH63_16415 [Desulfobulbaceae bacterium]|nr:hypothetical protein [Desulfobulbaceae bacterium]
MALVNIDRLAFEKVFAQSGNFILFCFQNPATLDDDFMKTVEKVTSEFSLTKFQSYLVCEDDFDFFQDTFNFLGTPVYILCRGGTEKDRLLGRVSEETLRQFISRNVNGATDTLKATE